ncbi:cadmium-translocating P-type ATPase [Treponema ruminis]|uniref:heavy metal translocating P-type ATPase n=1 Tax=Treponema ruminis TaxID=744515 RepID=UPI00197D3E26|nr:heavy metal translocating P-type ATPase [Treponema ruminis]QSI03359.1 cadmium-translocating P-type ATPase [Treponema ruminis]
MEQETRRKWIRVAVTSVLLVGLKIVEKSQRFPMLVLFLLYLVPYLVIGYDVLAEAWEEIREGEVFSEDFLMGIATIGALAIGFLPGAKPEFTEAVFVMLFFQVGEIFEDMAEDNSRKSITQLMDIRPDSANVEREGKILVVDPGEVAVGETIVVKPGEKVPMDGVVVEGVSSLDTVALTGESIPREVSVGDAVYSGCVNQRGLIRVQVSKVFGESTASKILELVEHASEGKSHSERFITRFARVYTPVVVVSAIAVAFLPPLFSGDFLASFSIWLIRALTFLVVSCPCALVISVPLTFFSGIGCASKHGILVKGSNYLEALSKAGVVVFDKTGTLTKGVFEVTAVHPSEMDETQLLHLAAHVERYSTHPIAASLRAAYPHESDTCTVEDVEEIAGQGVRAVVNGKVVCVGNTRLMDAVGAQWKPCEKTGTIIHVAVDGVYAGHIVISDAIKSDSKEAIQNLKAEGVQRTVMLTGDRKEVAESVAKALGLDDWHAGLLPAGKVDWVEKLLASKGKGRTLAFVGDGINDAPVLARADVGIAMGAMGSDAAIDAADVVLMDDRPSKIALVVRIARHTLAIAKENVVFAIAVKVAVLILAALGLAPMWLAVFADVGVMVLAVLNATRALKQRA